MVNTGYSTVTYGESEEVRNCKKSKLGCNISHQLMYDEFLQTDGDWCLSLKDDCFIKNYDEGKLRDIIAIATDNNSHFIQLYTNLRHHLLKNKLKKKNMQRICTRCFRSGIPLHTFISRKGIQLLKNMYPMNENIDKFLSNKIEELNSLC